MEGKAVRCKPSIMGRIRQGLAHVVAFILDSFAAITGFYYSKKYAAIARRLGIRPHTVNESQCPGLIIIQIDGLSYDHLQQALERHDLPNLRRMLRTGTLSPERRRDSASRHSFGGEGGFACSRWRCGLPSSTPAAQAGIMFGQNENIPAFRWYDKAHNVSLVCKRPGTVALLQSIITEHKDGILTGGVSYANIFDGDAASAVFTLSSFQPRLLFESVRGIGFLILFLLNPFRTVRTLYLVVKEYITDALQRLLSRLRGQGYMPFIGIFPLLRIFSNVVLRELVTFAILVDIYRGVPAIYATYYGYDEVAHHFGLGSIAARQALREIDRDIGEINRLRQAQISRPYSLIVLSDHGMTPSQPFEHRYGQTLGRYLAQQLGESLFLAEHAEGEQHSLSQAHFLFDELRAIERSLQPRTGRVARRIRLLVQRRLARGAPLPEWNMQRKQDVVVKDSGSLAHVYFNICNQRLSLSEISTAFPQLVVNLLAHEGIWLVVAHEGQQTLIMARNGLLSLERDGTWHIEGENPLLRLPEPWHAAEQIQRIGNFPCSGDLMLFGDYDPEKNTVICFERQWASHGGVGGPQDYPFVLYPREFGWDLSAVRNSCDLYPLLARQRGMA